MAPGWLTVLAWLSLAVCLGCALVIAYDIVVNRRRQPMGVMNFVFPLTALYLGPFALALYWRWARAAAATPTTMSSMSMSMSMASMPKARATVLQPAGVSAGDGLPTNGRLNASEQPAAPAERSRPRWVTLAIEVSHCGAGCSLGDVISEFAIFGLGLTIAGVTLWAEYAGDYLLALAFGIVFQYFAIAPMRGLRLKDGLIAATKADFISLTAFEVGLFGWMAIVAHVLFPAPHHLMPSSAAYWLLMQVGMIIGFLTSWPANVWLLRRGIKVPM
ncbi:MAG: rane protein [Frankiales bacterium]|nr:rane protein [Frankiales bacterium]